MLELSDSGLFEGIVSLTPIADTTVQHANAPVVVCAYFDDESRGINELARAEPIERIIEHLAEHGHRRFMHLAGDYAHSSARYRRQAFLDAVERLGLKSHGVVDCHWSADVALQAVLELPDRTTVTAVIAANDVLAAAALGAALRRGWSVPEDLSVTGWDNNPVGAAFTPALTTVEIDHVGLGRRAAQCLLNLLQAAAPPPAAESVARVIWRESTGPIAAPDLEDRGPTRAQETPREDHPSPDDQRPSRPAPGVRGTGTRVLNGWPPRCTSGRACWSP